MTLSVQIVVIVGSKKRKASMVQQFAELETPFPVFYLHASMPSNSVLYLPDGYSEHRQRHICCTKSHIRAVEYASRETSADVTIVMEDDVALHKTQFVSGVLELLQNWDSLMPRDSHMLSIGWIPYKNYKFYEPFKSDLTFKTIDNTKILEWFVSGTQAYMIKKSSAQKFYNTINHKTFEELYNHIKDLKHPHLLEENTFESVDRLLNRLLVQSIVFPPLIIERQEESIINGNVKWQHEIWDNYFKDHEQLRTNYWSYD
jgi:GR25 family glycosyltransferase involved in LPS biosynthesis